MSSNKKKSSRTEDGLKGEIDAESATAGRLQMAPGSVAMSPTNQSKRAFSRLELAPGVDQTDAEHSPIGVIRRESSTVPGAERVRGMDYSPGRQSFNNRTEEGCDSPEQLHRKSLGGTVASLIPTSSSTPTRLTTASSALESQQQQQQPAQQQPVLEAKKVEEPVFAEAVAVRFCTGKKLFRLAVILLLVTVIVVGLVLGLSGGNEGDDDASQATISPTEAPRPMLEMIRERGYLRCGVQGELDGFSILKAIDDNNTQRRVGFELDLCMAIAAAIFGGTSGDNHERIEAVVIASAERWTALANRSIDIITRTTTHTMERDIFQKNARSGFTFSVPFIYDGLSFGGIPPYPSECADKLQVSGDDCNDLRICTFGDSTHFDVLSDLLPTSRLVVVNATYTRLDGFLAGQCNVMAGVSHEISEVVAIRAGYAGPYELGKAQFTKEPLALVTREDDMSWSHFVDLVLQALVEAEDQGVSQDSSSMFRSTVNVHDLFGDEFANMFVHAIESVGNYGEMYDRHIGPIVPRKAINAVNANGTSGLMYAMPFGSPQEEGPGPDHGSVLDQVAKRGFLRCGIQVDRPILGTLNGLDAEFCRAVSSGLFSGVVDTIDFVDVNAGNVSGIEMLDNNELDLLAGFSARNSWWVSKSQPYYYNETAQDAAVLATHQDDPQWSDFVYWIVSAIIFAEEQDISSRNSNEMPGVELFGRDYERMLRDAILVVGNYGEIVSRVEGVSGPFRDGLNQLNNARPLGPQFYPLV